MIKLIKWISHKMGYKIAMIKIGGEVPRITIDGDKELLKYVDITGYTFKKEPVKRNYPKMTALEPIKPLTNEQLKEMGLSILVDVADCKNYKEASKVQEQVINGEVKINVIKK